MTDRNLGDRGIVASRRTIGRFAATGLMTAGLYFTLFVGLVEFAQARPGIAAAVAYATAILFNYFTQKIWTFSNEAPLRRSGYRYITLAVSLMILNSLIMIGLSDWLKINYLLAQVSTAVILILISFLAQRAWVFKRAES